MTTEKQQPNKSKSKANVGQYKELFFTDVPLPKGVAFIAKESHTSMYFLGYLFLLVSFLAHVAVLKAGHTNVQSHLVLFVVDLLSIAAIMRDRKDNQRFGDEKQRWGIFLTEKYLIYRTIGIEMVLQPRQVLDCSVKVYKDRGVHKFIRLNYRPKLHLPEKSMELMEKFSSPAEEINEKINRWIMQHKEDERDVRTLQEDMAQEAWESRIRDLYQYRHFLPDEVVGEMESIPSSVAARKKFIENIKPYEERMHKADKASKIALILFSVTNFLPGSIGVLLVLYNLIFNTPVRTPVGGLIFILVFNCVVLWIYGRYIMKCWNKRLSNLLPNMVIFVFYGAPVWVLLYTYLTR